MTLMTTRTQRKERNECIWRNL